MYQVIGTDGFANKYPNEAMLSVPTEQNLKAVPNHETSRATTTSAMLPEMS